VVGLTRVSLGRGYERSRGFELLRHGLLAQSEGHCGNFHEGLPGCAARKGGVLYCGDACCGFFVWEQGPDRHSLGRGVPIVTDQEWSEKEPLGIILLDVEAIEGKCSRRNGRDSDKANDTTMENVLWGHGGLVTGRNKGLPRCVPL
jgi:hypothetical protein